MNKRPRKSQLLEKVMAYLSKLPPGTQVTTPQLAAATGACLRSKSLHKACRPAVADGRLRAQQIHGMGVTVWWSLGAFAPVFPSLVEREEVEDTVDPLPRRTEAPWIQPRPGLLFPGVYAVKVIA